MTDGDTGERGGVDHSHGRARGGNNNNNNNHNGGSLGAAKDAGVEALVEGMFAGVAVGETWGGLVAAQIKGLAGFMAASGGGVVGG
jgi:hypothetical protein